MRSLAIIIGGLGLFVLANTVHAQQATVRGELITVMCFVGNGDKGRGADHAACALKCANEGYPLAILTESGEMYKIVGKLTADKNAALRELMATQVVAEGVVGEEGSGKTLDAASVKRAEE
jgi:hypothetical protein